MTLVSHDHRFIFLKTQKTAGTAVEMALEPYCAEPGHQAAHFTDVKVSDHGIIGARHRGGGVDKTNWYGHQSAAQVRDMLGEETFDSYTKVATMRNPFDKMVSYFHWKRDASGRILKSESKAETIDTFRRYIRQANRGGALERFAQVDRDVCFVDGELELDRLLRTETMEHDLQSFAQDKRLDTSRLQMQRPKTSARKKDKIRVPDYYDKKSADIVRKTFDWVFEIGDYSEQPHDAVRATRNLVTLMAAE